MSSTSGGNGEVTHLALLVAGAALAYVGRAIGGKLLNCATNYCCTSCCELDTGDEFLQLLVQGSANGDSGVDVGAIEGHSLTFDEAAARLKMNRCMARTTSALRLVFFHWSQPIAYCVALWWYYASLPKLQLYLGLIVGVREILYLLLTFACLFRNPAFLLVDSTATYRSSPWNLVLYVVAPEKYVFFCLGASSIIFLALLVLFDLVGVVALCAAVLSQVMPIPLMIGYGITTLGGFLIIFLVVIPNLNLSCCEPSLAQKVDLVTHGHSRFLALDLSDGTVRPDRGLLGALRREKTLKELNLKNTDLTQDLIELLAGSLKTNTTLLELEMDYTLLGTEALLTLFSTNHRALPTVLSLRNCDLTVADAFRISKMLAVNTTLRVLDLANNPDIGDQGSCALAHALSKGGYGNADNESTGGNKSEGSGSDGVKSNASAGEQSLMTGLDLSNCGISDKGAAALAKALEPSPRGGSPNLAWLFLYDNINITERMRRQMLTIRSSLAVGLRRSTNNVGGRGATSSTGLIDEAYQLLPGIVTEDESHPDLQIKRRRRRHARILTVSTQELTWEIQLQQLMVMSGATPKELKLMLQRDFVFTKVSFFGAAKYRRLKKRAKRLLTRFQYLYGSKTRDKNARRKLSQRMMDQSENEARERQIFKALVDGLSSRSTKPGDAAALLPSSHFDEKVLRACRSSSALLGSGSETV